MRLLRNFPTSIKSRRQFSNSLLNTHTQQKFIQINLSVFQTPINISQFPLFGCLAMTLFCTAINFSQDISNSFCFCKCFFPLYKLCQLRHATLPYPHTIIQKVGFDCDSSSSATVFWTGIKASLITRGCVSSRMAPGPFLLLTLPRSEQAGGHKELGGGTAGTANPSSAQGCPTLHGIVLSTKGWGKQGGRLELRHLSSQVTVRCDGAQLSW